MLKCIAATVALALVGSGSRRIHWIIYSFLIRDRNAMVFLISFAFHILWSQIVIPERIHNFQEAISLFFVH